MKRPKVKEKNGRLIAEKLRENIIKGDCCSSVDRISELPHEIIVSIPSLMSLKETAATSILSRRWRNHQTIRGLLRPRLLLHKLR